MNEQYMPRDIDTSCVVIEYKAAEVVDETLVKLLRLTSQVQVFGQYLVGQEPLYRDPITNKHYRWPGQRQYILLELEDEIRRSATALRWYEAHAGHPTVLQMGFVALTLYEQQFDRFIDVPVMPELGFYCSAS